MPTTKQGREINRLQVRSGLNDTEFAAAMGIHTQTLYKWKTGVTKKPLREVFWDKMRSLAGRKRS